ncbi:hypothetical protein ABFS82_06G073600 [Erythranthe guttata]
MEKSCQKCTEVTSSVRTSCRLPFFLKAFSTSCSTLCLCFFPEDEIYVPFCNSIDISKSPHFVKRLDAKDPNGSTDAPVSTILNVISSNICHQPFFIVLKQHKNKQEEAIRIFL